MRFDRALGVGATGGHGPIRYVVEEYAPGASIRFRFTGPKGFDGHHRYEMVRVGSHTAVLRHTLEMETHGLAVLSWPLVFRPLHDALIEDSLANARASVGHSPEARAWSPWVRLLRWAVSGGRLWLRRRQVVPEAEVPGQAKVTDVSDRRAQLLRAAFLAGAVTDALAVIPMLSPAMARLLWGFEDLGGPYRFAMGYGASLMAAWTGLLLWARQRPIERAFVAPLTVLVIYGLAATEIVAVVSGVVPAWRMLPTWVLQATLLGLFVAAYHHPVLSRRVTA